MLQQVYGNWSIFTGNNPIALDFMELLEMEVVESNTVSNNLDFNKSIVLKDINFKYPSSEEYILNNLNLTINKGDYIGIIGSTGSGKSTLLDVLMGLLSPEFGSIKIDDQFVTKENINDYRKKVAHVPQDIFLIDSTIKNNIAPGLKDDEINLIDLNISVEIAQLSELISKMDNGYLSITGERGQKLSGGQKQRIGIARALYHKKSILIFDEATSALDTITESKIISNLQLYSRDLTIIMVAHRLTSLKNCNRIVEMKNGKLIEKNIDELLN